MTGDPELVSRWRALVASHAAVTAALEHDLGERHGLGVTEFEVLERLAENPGHKFRVQELAESVHLSQSALSRMIGRLEQHGLVERSLCDNDRRGIYVCLTEAGRAGMRRPCLPSGRCLLPHCRSGARPGTEDRAPPGGRQQCRAIWTTRAGTTCWAAVRSGSR